MRDSFGNPFGETRERRERLISPVQQGRKRNGFKTLTDCVIALPYFSTEIRALVGDFQVLIVPPKELDRPDSSSGSHVSSVVDQRSGWLQVQPLVWSICCQLPQSLAAPGRQGRKGEGGGIGGGGGEQ